LRYVVIFLVASSPWLKSDEHAALIDESSFFLRFSVAGLAYGCS
jgi:hypothetical protein